MPDSTTASRDQQAGISVESVTSEGLPDRRARSGGLVASDRLRSIALETPVATLEPELRRERRRHQETIARYGEILQDCPEAGCVVTTLPADRE